MKKDEIMDFLSENIEPIEDGFYGKCYRAAVTLEGGIFLPCVVFSEAEKLIELAEKRLKDSEPHQVLESFLLKRNTINFSSVEKIEKSRNAIPLETLRKVHGETLPSFTGFVLKMRDGKLFNFGTHFSADFFEVPDDFYFCDVQEVISNSFADEHGEIHEYRKFRLIEVAEILKKNKIHFSMDYFTCYV